MKFLTAEQFLQADTKVQNAILDWWNPSVGDLVASIKDDNKYCVIDNFVEAINCCSLNIYNAINCTTTKDEVIPLLTIGQLIDFIEDKTDGKIDTEYDSETGYDIQIYNSYNKYRPKFNFVDYGKSLLQALWQVACEIILNTN